MPKSGVKSGLTHYTALAVVGLGCDRMSAQMRDVFGPEIDAVTVGPAYGLTGDSSAVEAIVIDLGRIGHRDLAQQLEISFAVDDVLAMVHQRGIPTAVSAVYRRLLHELSSHFRGRI